MAVPDSSGSDARTAESLIRDLERLRDVACAGCGQRVGPHQTLMGMAIGFKDAPRCLPCLGAALGQESGWLRDWLLGYIRQRECFWEAWNWANRAAGLAGGVLPPELQAPGAAAGVRPSPGAETSERLTALENSPALGREDDSAPGDGRTPLLADAEWDAGDMGCGDLVLELRQRLHALRPGQLFKLSARDPGAPQDLPAWCRLTGHTLWRAEHPTYWIQRKE
jgi:tRNA 2-thiouridine synthesizing protein A